MELLRFVNRIQSLPLNFYLCVSSFQTGVPFPIIVPGICQLLLILALYKFLQVHQCFLLIQILAAFLGTDDDLPSRQIDCSDTGFHLVHILPALAAAAKGFKPHLFRVKCFCFGFCAAAEIQKPLFAFMSGTVRALTNPLHRTNKLRQISIRCDPHNADRGAGLHEEIHAPAQISTLPDSDGSED